MDDHLRPILGAYVLRVVLDQVNIVDSLYSLDVHDLCMKKIKKKTEKFRNEFTSRSNNIVQMHFTFHPSLHVLWVDRLADRIDCNHQSCVHALHETCPASYDHIRHQNQPFFPLYNGTNKVDIFM